MLKVYGAINLGYQSSLISVECHVSNGLPGVTIVGLANKSVDEAKDRIRAAFASSGINFPKKKILINLAPADLPKNDSGLDMAIAVSILAREHKASVDNSLCIGELGLDGSIKPVAGIIGKLIMAKDKKVQKVFVPKASSAQAAMVPGVDVYVVDTLSEMAQIIQGETPTLLKTTNLAATPRPKDLLIHDVIGQEQAKRALVIAAAGGHNLHMYGPPGTGKTMLARAASEILPDLDRQESLEVTHLHSLNDGGQIEPAVRPPFRAPHHSASDVSIVGGGNNARPGEISMAHKGLLMLDELPEYSKNTLEALRQPLEDKTIVVSRAKLTTTYPADFMLVATSNPCPCGFYGSDKDCKCAPYEIIRYQKKLSGPIMDRIDMHVQVSSVDHKHLLSTGERLKDTTDYCELVIGARSAQKNRGALNGGLSAKDLKKYGKLSSEAKNFLDSAAKQLQLSSRGYLKSVRVARTIADLERSEAIEKEHISESLQYRHRGQDLF